MTHLQLFTSQFCSVIITHFQNQNVSNILRQYFLDISFNGTLRRTPTDFFSGKKITLITSASA